MVTSLLYYRTDTTRRDQTLDPRNLPTPQILEFDQPNRVLEGIQELYENIITRQVSVNQGGVRRIFNRDDGMKMRDFSITGRLDKANPTLNINKIIDFRTRSQRGAGEGFQHPHGIIGFLSGNSTSFNTDPNATGSGVGQEATRGLMIGKTEIGYSGRVFHRLMFRMTLHFGGLHETVTVV